MLKERNTVCSVAGSAESFIAIDVETTGMSPMRGDRVIELGAVIVQAGIVKREFQSLIRTEKRIASKARQVHGITEDMLSNEPGPEEVFLLFRTLIRDNNLIAHNAEFDRNFLRHEFSRLGMILNNQFHCTMKMSRKRCPGLPDYRLETVYRHVVKCDAQQRHRALDDARMVARVWMEMMKR